MLFVRCLKRKGKLFLTAVLLLNICNVFLASSITYGIEVPINCNYCHFEEEHVNFYGAYTSKRNIKHQVKHQQSASAGLSLRFICYKLGAATVYAVFVSNYTIRIYF